MLHGKCDCALLVCTYQTLAYIKQYKPFLYTIYIKYKSIVQFLQNAARLIDRVPQGSMLGPSQLRV